MGNSGGRVVITGMGWITPLGDDVGAVWERLLKGDAAAGPVTRFPARTFLTNFAAEVRGFDLRTYLSDTRGHEDAHVNSLYALGAASRAWKQAGFGDLSRPGGAGRMGNPRRLGIYLGAGEGILDFDNYAEANIRGWDASRRAMDDGRWAQVAYARMERAREVEQEPQMAVSHLAEAFGARGPCFNCMTACAASTQAIGEAFEIISRGDADVMLAGGTHSMIHPLGMTGFIRLTAMSKRSDSPLTASRPFDSTRDGFVMGEGAGIVVLESLDHALARGARPLAEVAGYGSSADSYRITDIQPEGLGAVAAMAAALREAGIDPKKADSSGRPPVQYLSAHGTGTKENDSIETLAVKTLFGEQAKRVPFSSVKSMLGHLIQAAGAVELITCVQSILTGFVPPTINLHSPDPRCDLDYVPNVARDLRGSGGVETAMSNSFGFGGQNNTIVVKRFG
ncbi:MAG: beta-ketoacyl-[acyl-carrier-protein] synthase family protein [Phycisphaerae bacterium]|nr:beta-ketoacyl-[acyl-carrier-protein] synthase family protein [Phycisphaerae bacterium]